MIIQPLPYPPLPTDIEFVGRKSFETNETAAAQTISLTDLVGGIGTAPQEGDFIVVSWGVGSIGVDFVANTPSGYTNEADLFSNDTYDSNLHVWYKFAGSAEISVTVDGPGSARALQVIIRVYRGVNPTTPLDVASVPASGFSWGKPNPNPITPITPGAWVIAIGHAANADLVPFTSSDLTDFISANRMTTVDSCIGSGHKTDWVSGPFNPGEFGGGHTASGCSWTALTMALRPA